MYKWRNTCPDALLTRLENVAETRFYLLRQTGPTGFLVKEHDGETKFKVLLGSTHSCDCSTFLKEKELCLHILWILIKKFRIPKDNPVAYQLGLCERELNNVIYGKKQELTKPEKAASAGINPNTLKQKPIDEDDVCPICQDEIYKTKRALTFCKFGCGNSVHISCMKIWADHQYKSTQEEVIKCPLCRTEFSNYKSILNEHRQAMTKSRMMKKQRAQQRQESFLSCNKCKSKHQQNLYRCCACFNLYLCSRCFSSGIHKEHSFELKGENGKWKVVEKPELMLRVGGSNFSSNKQASVHLTTPNSTCSILKKPGRLSCVRSSSFTDLRGLSLGISGLRLQKDESSNESTNHKTPPSHIRLPPLPSGNKCLMSTKSPSRRVKFPTSLATEDLVVMSSPIKSASLGFR